MNQEFIMYKMVVFPTRILDEQYVQFVLDYQYLVINSLHQNYLLMTEWELTQCKGQDVLVCPVSRAVYSTKLMTYELSLYFQLTLAQKLCQRELLKLPVHPRLEQHGAVRSYYWPQQQPVHFRCHQQGSWVEFTLVLQGAGVLYNASACYIATTELQVYPERKGEATYAVPTPRLYAPDGPMVLADHELGTLRELIAINTTEVDQLTTRITSHRYGGDVNNLLQLHAVHLQHQRKFSWVYYALISMATVIILMVVYHFSSPYFFRLLSRCDSAVADKQRNDPLPNEVIPSNRDVELSSISIPNIEPMGGAQENPQIRFSTCSIQRE
jgi:hypothetical protein